MGNLLTKIKGFIERPIGKLLKKGTETEIERSRWEDNTVWKLILPHLDRTSFKILNKSWPWFRNQLFAENSSHWRDWVLFNFPLQNPGKVNFNWKNFYVSHSFNRSLDEDFLSYVGSINNESLKTSVWVAPIFLRGGRDLLVTTQTNTTRIPGVRGGIWIAEAHFYNDDYLFHMPRTIFTLRHHDYQGFNRNFVHQSNYLATTVFDDGPSSHCSSPTSFEYKYVQDAGFVEAGDGVNFSDWCTIDRRHYMLNYQVVSNGVKMNGILKDGTVAEEKSYRSYLKLERDASGNAVLILVINNHPRRRLSELKNL